MKRILMMILLMSLLSACTATLPQDEYNTQSGQAYSYDGLTPGVTTRSKIISEKGTPNSIRTWGDYESLHYYYTDWSYELFLLKKGVLQTITSDSYKKSPVTRKWSTTPNQLYSRFGTEDVITPEFGDVIHIYYDDGVAVSDNGFFQYFIPMSKEEYLKEWTKKPLGMDPFPLIPNIDTSGLTIGSTTREQVIQILGQPDLIFNWTSNIEYFKYFGEPNTYGTVYLYFDKDHILCDIAIMNMIKPMTYENVVEHYGLPEKIRRSKNDLYSGYAFQSLMYFEKGMVFLAQCPDQETCLRIDPTTPVHSIYYSSPTTFSDYIIGGPYGEYFPWQGFDD